MSHIREFARSRFLSYGTALALLVNCSSWLFLTGRIAPQEQHIALHYNIYFGIDLVGPWWYLILLPIAGVATLLVNLFLSVILLKREKVLAYFLTVTSILVQGFFFLAVYLALTQV